MWSKCFKYAIHCTVVSTVQGRMFSRSLRLAHNITYIQQDCQVLLACLACSCAAVPHTNFL